MGVVEGGLWDAETGPDLETPWGSVHASGALLSLAGNAQLFTRATKSHPDPPDKHYGVS